MKKTLIFILTAALALFTLACNKDGGGDAGQMQTPQGGVKPPSDNKNEGLSGELQPGTYTSLNSAGGFRLKGLKLSSERTGTAEGINGWEPSLVMIRTVFELDEWIDYSMEYEYGDEDAKLGVWVFSHRELSEYSDFANMRGDAFFCEYELPYETYPLALDDAFMLQSKLNKSGDYDMLFTLDGTIIGGTLLRLVENGALADLTDEQIMSMMAVG